MKFFIVVLIMMVSLTVYAGDFESFSEFQTHIKNESQRVSDMELHQQIKFQQPAEQLVNIVMFLWLMKSGRSIWMKRMFKRYSIIWNLKL
jgi:hypothetical protein